MLVEPWLSRAARLRPGLAAVLAPEGALTYAQMDAAAGDAARRLAARGARPGERVALALPAGLPFVVALHGCLRLGAVAVPIDVRLARAEQARRAAGCAVLVDCELDGPVDRGVPLPASHDLDADAIVVHTSGTTAAARPVALTYGNWLWSALGSAVALGLDRDERWLCTVPLSHVGGLSILVRSAIYATTAEVHGGFDVARALVALEGPVTLVSVVPTILARLLDAGLREPAALRTALLGGAPIAPALLERARAAGVPTTPTYGLTQACSQVTTGGAPLFCTRVRIETSADAGSPGVGEILVSGPTVAPAVAGPDGWLRTGDLGALRPDGSLAVTGRATDTIVSGGENVAPAAVEAVLEDHPAVAEAGVHGAPDPEWGERVVATVVLRAGRNATSDQLRAYCHEHLAGHEVPKVFRYSSSLPKTPSGKLRRRSLEDHQT